MSGLAYEVDVTYAGTTGCPIKCCPGEGEYVSWTWAGGRWRELLCCDTCHTRFYSGATRIGIVNGVTTRTSPRGVSTAPTR